MYISYEKLIMKIVSDIFFCL